MRWQFYLADARGVCEFGSEYRYQLLLSVITVYLTFLLWERLPDPIVDFFLPFFFFCNQHLHYFCWLSGINLSSSRTTPQHRTTSSLHRKNSCVYNVDVFFDKAWVISQQNRGRMCWVQTVLLLIL